MAVGYSIIEFQKDYILADILGSIKNFGVKHLYQEMQL